MVLVKKLSLIRSIRLAIYLVMQYWIVRACVCVQAVGRVDRIGQTRPTTVHHFVVEETVEENVAMLYKKRVRFSRFCLSSRVLS
jgi:hypothetical protein